MQINRTMAIVCLLCLVSFSALVRTQEIRRDGRWEVTMEMDMPNMPMKMPPMKTVQCVTKEQVDDPNQLPKGAQEKNKDCKVSDYKVTGNTVTWTMTCTGKNAMTGTGEMTYSADSYEGSMKMKTATGEMAMKYTGKRLGDCTK